MSSTALSNLSLITNIPQILKPAEKRQRLTQAGEGKLNFLQVWGCCVLMYVYSTDTFKSQMDHSIVIRSYSFILCYSFCYKSSFFDSVSRSAKYSTGCETDSTEMMANFHADR